MFSENGRILRGLFAFNKVIDDEDAPPVLRRRALRQRAHILAFILKNRPAASSDYEKLLDDDTLHDSERAEILLERAALHEAAGYSENVILDCTAILELPNASTEKKADALLTRADEWAEQEDYAIARTDYIAAAAISVTPVQKAAAHHGLAQTHLTEDEPDFAAAIEEYDAFLALEDLPPETRARGLAERAVLYEAEGLVRRAIDDCSELLSMPDISGDLRARAFFLRGKWRAENGDIAASRADHALVFSFLPLWANTKTIFWLLFGLGVGGYLQWRFNADLLFIAKCAFAAVLIWFIMRRFNR
jgi:lipoprotein NlpI